MAADIYKKAFDLYGESPKSLHWVNYPSMAFRFKNLVADVDLEDRTILDAGCGMGDLLPYIYAKANRFSYTGIDINEKFIAVAKKRYQGHLFKVGDPFFGKLRTKYDVVLSSGVMNHNVPDWLNLRKRMITRLFETANETLAFNMAGSFEALPPDGKIAYADAGEILEFCLALCKNSSLLRGYSNYDFTIVMNK